MARRAVMGRIRGRGESKLLTARPPLLVLSGLVFLAMLAGCGSASPSAEPTDAQGAEPTGESASEVSSPPPPAQPSFNGKLWLEVDIEQPDGSTGHERLELGNISRANDFVPPAGFDDLTTVCAVDDQRDAVIPGRLIVRSTTSGFPLDLQAGMEITRPILGAGEYGGTSYKGIVTDVAQTFRGGEYACDGEGESSEPSVTEFELDPGQTGRQNFLILVRDYYSPKFPGGNSEELAFLRVRFSPAAAVASRSEYTCISSSAPLDGEAVRLDGGPTTDEGYDATDLPAC